MPRPYGAYYRRTRRALTGLPCSLRLVCNGAPSTSADHDPPISRHLRPHVDGSGCCVLRPACMPCQHAQAALLGYKQAGRLDRRKLPAPSRSW